MQNNIMCNILQLSKIRYIMDESFGSTNSSFVTSWVELQAIDKNNNNVAANKIIKSNFIPSTDVTGQTTINSIINDKISLNEWVSVNVPNSKDTPKIIVDLCGEYELKQIHIYHGWWTERSYKNIVSVSLDGKHWINIYDYTKDLPVFESLNKPMIFIL